MIKKENVKHLLELMHFTTDDDNIYVKFFDNSACIIVNLKDELIKYPDELKVNDKTTSNFEHPENFVVLECVTRLLTKGYFARNIELEPRWQLGRGASGGKADILIKDNNGHEFLIIECKTFGEEFDKAWQKTLIDGDQLFSYAQQIKKTQYLCLYTSNIDDNKLIYTDRIMTLKDNEDFLKTLKISQRLRYKEASDVKELYRVWKNVYNLEYEETGIFEDEVAPYEINKIYSIKDLKSVGFEDTQKKYNEFATILRQHNVSGHENAFDKLINIFLAKIVDEIQHPNSLKFNWKGIAFDDYYQLQDRLQKLYKDGMQKFLNEEVTYIDNKQITSAFKLFKNDPDATKDKVMSYFRELKFFTNNDFAFIDVHNEELFKQNSEILLKMVKMFQDIKLKTEEQNQFLGDLFEGFLDDGIKQSEGQFFTPLPITRFIVSSLPLKEIIEENDNYPKVIDYACGAGHFLNEYASQVKRYFNSEEELQNCYSEIDGIEKEYRLSKVSKVSAFMYGQDNINITYGDALADNKNIKDGQYDILIANPPYSVKGFLETLTEEERNKYSLTKLVNKNTYSTNNSIETFFVEKAKQLLKPGGVAGIILPASLLTNGSNLYTSAREIILKNFDVISIVELPSGTFGATGTNTVTLFLRKKDENPPLAEHFKNRVDSWFNGNFDKDEVFDDKEILVSYLKMQNIEYNDYIELLTSHELNENLKNHDMFKAYLNDSKVKSISKILELEKDKLYYYMLASEQENSVIVVNAPSSKDDIKRYLGYEWSNRKGSEGIKYIGANSNDNDSTLSKNKGIEKINTPLFNQEDLFDNNKINSCIRNCYLGKEIITSDKKQVKKNKLVDLLNFNKTTFDKSISLNITEKIVVKSKYEVDKLSNLTSDILKGQSITRESTNEGNYKVVAGGTDYAYKIDKYNRDENIITISASGANAGFVNFWKEKIFASDCTTIKGKNDVETKYIYYYLKSIPDIMESFKKGAAQPHVYPDDIKNIPIPLAPTDIQEKIISECEKTDEEYLLLKANIEKCKKTIDDLFKNKQSNTIDMRLDNKDKFKLSIGSRVLKSELIDDGRIPVISANVNEIFGKIDKEIIDDYSSPYILWGIDGDWMIRYLEKGIRFYPTDHCGYIKVLDDNINPLYLSKIIEIEGKKQRFSRSNRASTDRVSSLVIKLPSKDIQNEIAKQVKELTEKITKTEELLHNYENKKTKIIEKYLK